MIPWNDEQLAVSSDDATRRKYRRLQSWYRQHVLEVEPGLKSDSEERKVGSMLPAGTGDLNFLTDAVKQYVGPRVKRVLAAGGSIDEDRLRRNMLSSMPLCFNLFGELRASPEAAARVLAATFHLPIAKVEAIEVEWTPKTPIDPAAPSEEHPLQDRTAFDAVVFYRDRQGRRGLVGVETKYTEPFSQKEYPVEDYEPFARASGQFRPDAATRLVGAATNQAWRNLLLVFGIRSEEPFAHRHMTILALYGDKGATAAFEGLERELLAPAESLRSATLEALVAHAAGEPTLADWAKKFRARYLALESVGAN